MKKETEFYNKLQDIFVGAKVDGEGGFINLMRMKSGYYEQIKTLLLKDVQAILKADPDFREELFDKLYSFFNRYFTQNGSIAFNDTAFHNNAYEKVYTNSKDVALFWKTQMLYYVKTDSLYESMPVELDDGIKFYFDCGNLKNKKANEKKRLIFTLADVSKDEVIILDVSYAENGCKTKVDEILGALHEKSEYITEKEFNKAIRIFKKQIEVDYFINKNAKDFLQEQFKLWSYQYFWDGAKEWKSERVNQLNMLRTIAYKIIDFIAEFEDELVRVWNKPKFVKNSNYVITLDRLNEDLVKKIKSAKSYKEQLAEWHELGIDENNPKAPIDTKFFKGLELEILAQFDDLDEALDGWLIKSENYQALNTILPKFREKIQCIYIDPPFNTGSDFEYIDKYRNSTWLTLMSDRIKLAKEFMSDTSFIYLQLDHYADYFGRMLLIDAFPNVEIADQSVITWNTGDNISGFKTQRENWIRQADKIIAFPKQPDKAKFVKLWNPVAAAKEEKIGWLDFIGKDKDNLYIEIWKNGNLEQMPVSVKSKRIGTVWNDIYSFQYSEPRETESFSFKTQKPENLLRRVIQSCSFPSDFVLDFYSGTGTTAAVAHKLNRKWIAVEYSEHINTFYYDQENQKTVGVLGRMKIVVKGDQKFTLPNTPEERNPHLSKNIEWQGGGFFKYYELEQYEEVLKHCKYEYEEGDEPENRNLLYHPDTSAYEQYVFMHDEKMLKAIEIDHENNEVNLNLNRLYDNIDLAETLSNYMGKNIKSITKEEVIFSDGSRENLAKPDYRKVKPLIWWER